MPDPFCLPALAHCAQLRIVALLCCTYGSRLAVPAGLIGLAAASSQGAPALLVRVDHPAGQALGWDPREVEQACQAKRSMQVEVLPQAPVAVPGV